MFDTKWGTNLVVAVIASLHILILKLLYHHHLLEAPPVPVVLHFHLVVVVSVLPGVKDQGG